MRTFLDGAAVPASGLLLIILSNVMVRPRKSPASWGLQFVHMSIILLDLERLFDLQEAIVAK